MPNDYPVAPNLQEKIPTKGLSLCNGHGLKMKDLWEMVICFFGQNRGNCEISFENPSHADIVFSNASRQILHALWHWIWFLLRSPDK
jgi:hypothetical protein